MPLQTTYQVEMRPLGSLRPYARNPRKHPKRQIEELKANIQGIGFTNPLLIDPEGGVIAGHGRLQAAKELGLQTVPCIILGGLTDDEKRAVIIADNKISTDGVWDEALLKEELRHLSSISFDMDLTGFDFKGLGDLEPKLVVSDVVAVQERAREGDAATYEKATGLEQVSNIDIVIRRDDTQFPSSNSLGIPYLLPEALGDILPSVPWNRREPMESSPSECVFTWGEHRRSVCTPDCTRGATLCFFEEDEVFSGIWDSPSGAVARMQRYEWGQVVAPDFTFYRDAPLVIQYYGHFKCMYMARYFQEAGFKVVPKLHLVDPLDPRVTGWQYFGIPIGSPVIAVQVNTVYGRTASKDSFEQRGMFYRMMEEAVGKLRPDGVIIYGGAGSEDHLRTHLPGGPEYRIIPSISTLHRSKNKKVAGW